MNKLNEILNKYLVYALYGILLFSFLNTCSTKTIKKESIRMKHEIDSLTTQINILKDDIYSKDELDARMKILGYQVSKRTLYDWNYIVRTKNRPDDQMNEYDQKIEAERKTLEKIMK